MTTVFLIISLILNIITILAVIILYLRQNRFFQVEQKQEKMIKELEELISAYLAEMKEENDQFIKRFLKKSQNKEEKTVKVNIHQPVPLPEKSDPSVEKENNPYKIKNTVALHAVNAYKKNKQEMPTSSNELENNSLGDMKQHSIETPETKLNEEESLLQQALRLKEQGLTNEDVARKLNRGKTEIELLLKFNQN